jgi:hypothetical protein
LSVVGDTMPVTTASARDIASALRQRLPDIGVKKLHKLLYYAQDHRLAAFGRPLFCIRDENRPMQQPDYAELG